MANKSIEIQLTLKNDAGPLFDLYYGTDGINYTASAENPILLPSLNSTYIATVDSTATVYKLKSRGTCQTEYTFGAFVTPTPTPTTTGTPTPTPTVSPTPTPTPTPCRSMDNTSYTYNYHPLNPSIACAGNGTNVTTYVTLGTIPFTGDVLYADPQGCDPVSPGYYAVSGNYFTVDQFGEITDSDSCTTPTPPATPVVYEVGDRTDTGSPFAFSTCGDTADTPLYASVSSFASVGVGTTIYTDINGTLLVGGNSWYGITATTGTPTLAIQIDNLGVVQNDFVCSDPTPTPGPTGTPTPTPTPGTCFNYYYENTSVFDSLTIAYTDCTTGGTSFLTVSGGESGYICSTTLPIRSAGTQSYLIYQTGLCPTPTPTPSPSPTPGATATPTPTPAAECIFGTHTVSVTSGVSGVFKATWIGTGNAYLARNMVTYMTGVQTPSENVIYDMAYERVNVYKNDGERLCALFDTFNAKVVWGYEGSNVFVQVNSSSPLVYTSIPSAQVFCYQRVGNGQPTPTPSATNQYIPTPTPTVTPVTGTPGL